MKNRIFLLQELFKKYDDICEKRMQNIEQIFIDFIEEKSSELHDYIDRDFSQYFIENDFILSISYDVDNILAIAKEDIETTVLFKEFKEELLKIKE